MSPLVENDNPTTVSYNSVPIEGNLLVAYVELSYDSIDGHISSLELDSWTALTIEDNTDVDFLSGFFYKIAGSDDQDVSVSWSDGEGFRGIFILTEYTGINQTSPYLTDSAQSNEDGVFQTPSITPTSNKNVLIICGLTVFSASPFNISNIADAKIDNSEGGINIREVENNGEVVACVLWDGIVENTSTSYQGSASPNGTPPSPGAGSIAVFSIDTSHSGFPQNV